jgi:hypothetical protein
VPCFKHEQSRHSLLIVALLIGISGCGQKNTTRDTGHETGNGSVKPDSITPTPGTQASGSTKPGERLVSVNGIAFELPWQVDALEALKAVGPTGISFTNGKQTLEVANEGLRLNGKDYGPVNKGDRVKLTKEGVVSVNGAERKPADTKP